MTSKARGGMTREGSNHSHSSLSSSRTLEEGGVRHSSLPHAVKGNNNNNNDSTAAIEMQILTDRESFWQYKQIPKLLILGAGEAGKSTFLKQLRLADGQSYSSAEKITLKARMLKEAIEALKMTLVICAQNEWSISVQESEVIMALETDSDLSNALGLIQRFLQRRFIIQALAIGSRYNMSSNCDYLLSKLPSLLDPFYELTTEDILHVRIQTTSIQEHRFNLRGGMIVYDVGGQRGMRKQWMPYFDMVHAIVFVADISCYDQALAEDATINRMHDALTLYGNIVNAPLLRHISLVLLLNKMDVLKRKVAGGSKVSKYFPDFQVPAIAAESIQMVSKFFLYKFGQQNGRTKKNGHVSSHTTQCTDTKGMRIIVQTVCENVVRANLNDFGIL